MRDKAPRVTNPGGDMRLLDHLEELRRRIIVAVLAVVIAATGCFFLSDWILQILLLPSGGLRLRAFGLMDGFTIKLRIALYAGIVAAFPVWAHQALRFVGPGLLPEERRRTFPFLVAMLVLFAGGTAFGFNLLSMMVKVFVRLFPPQIEYLPSAEDYLSFVVFFLLACGIVFELPCVLLLLVRLRVLRAEQLRKGRRVAWFILFAFAEIITPVADPIVAPLAVMVPLVVLYEASVIIARRMEARRGVKPGAKVASQP
jgi:sec-independent protein translocase protein TatC